MQTNTPAQDGTKFPAGPLLEQWRAERPEILSGFSFVPLRPPRLPALGERVCLAFGEGAPTREDSFIHARGACWGNPGSRSGHDAADAGDLGTHLIPVQPTSWEEGK